MLDTDQFKKSDINYLIYVKVTNHTGSTFAPENTKFNKLKGMKDSGFAESFGDSFISGFLEGGELIAVVSIKVASRRQKETVMGLAKVALSAGGVDEEQKKNARKQLQENAEIAITVNWTGGGKLKDGES